MNILVGISDTRERSSREIQATTNTKRVFATVPAAILKELSIEVDRTCQAKTADGQYKTMEMGTAIITIEGTKVETPVIFGEDAAQAEIGSLALTYAMLKPDEEQQRLVPLTFRRINKQRCIDGVLHEVTSDIAEF